VICEFAPAKINLFLHVGRRCDDGFHLLQSLVAFADVGDTIAVEPARTVSLVIEGPFARALAPEHDNIILRTVQAASAKSGIDRGVRIALTKNLPVAAGIGGGSADAAATLRCLQRLWGVTKQQTGELAESLGADVPVCLVSSPAWMEGRGERVSPASVLPPVFLLLVNPGIAIQTATVFGALGVRRGVEGTKPARWTTFDDFIAYLRTTSNDLEAPAHEIAPSIASVLAAISGCQGAELARVSGSGPTCFGLFRQSQEAAAAAEVLNNREPSWWIRATELRPRGALTSQTN